MKEEDLHKFHTNTLLNRSILDSQRKFGRGQVNKFNHPVKELVQHNCADVNEALAADNTFTSCLLQLGGHDRFRKRVGSYFRDVQRYQHWYG